MEQEQTTSRFGPYGSFKDLFLSYPIGTAFTLAIGLVIVSGVASGLSNLFQDDLLYQQQAIGNSIPDVYIERDGVKFFSQVDGKNIEDLLSK